MRLLKSLACQMRDQGLWHDLNLPRRQLPCGDAAAFRCGYVATALQLCHASLVGLCDKPNNLTRRRPTDAPKFGHRGRGARMHNYGQPPPAWMAFAWAVPCTARV